MGGDPPTYNNSLFTYNVLERLTTKAFNYQWLELSRYYWRVFRQTMESVEWRWEVTTIKLERDEKS